MALRVTSNQAMAWSLWAACALAIAGAVLTLAAPPRDSNRIAPMALPLALAAAALAVNALTQKRNRWLAALLYALAGLAIVYALMVGLSVPLSLLVEGACQPAPAPCPLGFAHPLTAGESFGLKAAGACGAFALVLTFVAVELQFRPRLRLFAPPPASSSPEPAPHEPTDPAAKTDT